MGNFNRDDKRGGGFGRGGFGGGRKFGGHGDGPRQMFSATCSKCGQSCEVPFKPTGERPVFCNNCFKSQGGPSQRFAPKSFNAPVSSGGACGGVSKAQIDSLNAKLDKILAILSPAKVEVSEIKKAKKEKAPAKKVASKKSRR